MKPACRFVDTPIRWYRHSRSVLLRYGLTPLSVDSALSFLKSKEENHPLVVGTQVDDFLYARAAGEVSKFEFSLRKIILLVAFHVSIL